MKPKIAIFLLPHKSFTRIEKEYGVKFDKSTIRELANVFVDGSIEKCIEFLWNLAEKQGIEKDRRPNFIYDVCRATGFYIAALKKIEEVLSKRNE